MPYTHEKTSNTIEDKNKIKSRTHFHVGPQHKTSGQDKTLTECVIINKNFGKKSVRTEMKCASNR